MSFIELKNIDFSYSDHGRVYKALEGIDLNIEEGEFVCIIGRSGCGKTTLLKLIAGLMIPDNGSVIIDNSPVNGPGTDRAMVFQSYTLFDWMTVLKNVSFGIRQANTHISRMKAAALALEALKQTGMDKHADKYPYQLSGGMKQRVAIARAIGMNTKTLLLDEPFGALYTRIRSELQSLLINLVKTDTQKKTAVFITHDINEAILLADRIIYMTPKKIAEDIKIALPRPRSIEDEQVKALKKQLTDLFFTHEDRI